MGTTRHPLCPGETVRVGRVGASPQQSYGEPPTSRVIQKALCCPSRVVPSDALPSMVGAGDRMTVAREPTSLHEAKKRFSYWQVCKP